MAVLPGGKGVNTWTPLTLHHVLLLAGPRPLQLSGQPAQHEAWGGGGNGSETTGRAPQSRL